MTTETLAPATSRVRVTVRRFATLSLTVTSLLLASVAIAPAALAHHPEIEIDDLSCTGHLWFTATAWQTSDATRRVNNEIGIYVQTKTGNQESSWVRLPHDPSYRFNAQNNYSFSDHFDVTGSPDQVRIRARAEVRWGPNENINGVGSSSERTSSWSRIPDCSSISGLKFHDLDGDGTRDDGEPVLEGWTIHVSGTDGFGDDVQISTETDSDGTYRFELNPGTYVVCETIPDPWRQSRPGSGPDCDSPADGNGYHVDLGSEKNERGRDFGNYRNAQISGHKHHDEDADGSVAGDPPLSGWTIVLTGHDGKGNAVSKQDVTNHAGRYSFFVAPGTYHICEVIPDGWTQSYPATGHECSSPASGSGHTIEAVSGEHHRSNDFGNHRKAVKAGTKFEDLNRNGVRDEGEPGLPGVTIHIFGANGFHTTTVTDENGGYSFDLPPGSYLVCEQLPAGWFQSAPTEGPACEEFGTIGYTIRLGSGQVDQGHDFGNWRHASVSGTKFADRNADGGRSTHDPGLAGITIYVDYNDNGIHDDGEPFAISGSDGSYHITGVVPGTYNIREILPSPWVCSHPEPCRHRVTISSGDEIEGKDFGNHRPGLIAGAKFHDLDADGIRDEDEPGLGGWTITLTGATGAGDPVSKQTTTQDDGSYTFSNLTPGDYDVCEVIPNPWTQSYPTEGVACEDGLGHFVHLTTNEKATGLDFGNFGGGSVGGVKFDDQDRDGTRDEDEPVLGGWTISLVDAEGQLVEQTQTDENGSYSFTVAPGDYLVCEETRSAALWVQSHPAEGADCSEHGGGVGYAVTVTSLSESGGLDFGNFLLQPDIDVVKTADPVSGSPGTIITYTYVVTNIGEVTLFDVTVDDDQLGMIGTIAEMAPGEVVELTAQTTLGTASITNVVVVTGTDAIERTVTDEDTAVVTVVLGTIQQRPPLPRTGTDVTTMVDIGAMLLGFGLATRILAHRRRRFQV